MSLVTNYVNNGDIIDYTNPSSSATIAAGTPILQGQVFGVAADPILPSRLGALIVRGLFDLPKSTAASTAIAVGAKVYWDATNSLVTGTASTNVEIGKCVKAAVDGDALARVYIRM